MSAIGRINKSPLSARNKKTLRDVLRKDKKVAVLSSTYTHTQSNTTLANVTGLSVPVEAGVNYRYEIWLLGAANASGGLKFGVTAPTATGTVYGGQTVVSTSTAATSVATIAGGVTAAAVPIHASGVYKPSTDGTFQVQAAQNASNASDSTILPGSYLILEEIIV